MENQDWKTEIFNLFRRFKLANSVVTSKVKITPYVFEATHLRTLEIEKLLKDQMVRKMSGIMFDKYKPEITHGEFYNEYELKLLVLSEKEFKTIVEAVIEMLPYAEIEKIKAGKQL